MAVYLGANKVHLNTVFDTGHKKYLGPYEITPKTYDQTLKTKNLLMINDTTVKEIPYSAVSNLYDGITVTIGD